jgi:hypothetical protein
MDAFTKMDIFFVVSTMAVALVAVLVGYLLYRIIRLVRTLDRIAGEVKDEAHEIRSDIQHLRRNARDGKFSVTSLLSFFGKTVKRTVGRTFKKKT